MADTNYSLFRGNATATTSTLFTSASGSATLVTNIAITNPTTSSATYSLSLGGFTLQGTSIVQPNATQYIDLEQPVFNGETITGNASTTAVVFHIAGFDIV